MKIKRVLVLTCLSSCNNFNFESMLGKNGVQAAKICAGHEIAGVVGTANCQYNSVITNLGDAENFSLPWSRSDEVSVKYSQLVADFVSGNFTATRSVATFRDATANTSSYALYSVIPRPLDESDGRYAFNTQSETSDPSVKRILPAKADYLVSITGRPDKTCGESGSIASRIADCFTKNQEKSIYSGAQYGKTGEGDWKLVTRLPSSDEVWQDQRTKLIWSDRSINSYNWFQASGYAKPKEVSWEETLYVTEPGLFSDWDQIGPQVLQPSQPISVCPDVVNGEIAAGGGFYNTYQANPETLFKGNISYSDGVIWRLPSLSDWQLAAINGIRKVHRRVDDYEWTSTTYSYNRRIVWLYFSDEGGTGKSNRHSLGKTYCVGIVQE